MRLVILIKKFKIVIFKSNISIKLQLHFILITSLKNKIKLLKNLKVYNKIIMKVCVKVINIK